MTTSVTNEAWWGDDEASRPWDEFDRMVLGAQQQFDVVVRLLKAYRVGEATLEAGIGMTKLAKVNQYIADNLRVLYPEPVAEELEAEFEFVLERDDETELFDNPPAQSV